MPPRRFKPEPPIYTFRVRILGGYYAPEDSREIWREIEIAGNQTLADLGYAIPWAFDFDDPHLWSFFLSGKAWDKKTEYTIEVSADPFGDMSPQELAETFAPPDSPEAQALLDLIGQFQAEAEEDEAEQLADAVLIRDVPYPGKTGKKEFLFLFDYGDEWHFGVKLLGASPTVTPRAKYPRVTASHGAAPPQYPMLDEDDEEDWEDEDWEDEEEAEADEPTMPPPTPLRPGQ